MSYHPDWLRDGKIRVVVQIGLDAMANFVSRRAFTIEWGQCDPAGIVFNSRFFEFFDVSTWIMFETVLGVPRAELFATYDIMGIPLVDARARFVVPVKFGEAVEMTSQVSRVPPLQLRRRAPADDRRRTCGRGPRDAGLGDAGQGRSGKDQIEAHPGRGHRTLQGG